MTDLQMVEIVLFIEFTCVGVLLAILLSRQDKIIKWLSSDLK
jgi:hypothetical protein